MGSNVLGESKQDAGCLCESRCVEAYAVLQPGREGIVCIDLFQLLSGGQRIPEMSHLHIYIDVVDGICEKLTPRVEVRYMAVDCLMPDAQGNSTKVHVIYIRRLGDEATRR